ncbi:MAG: hypothetical protein QQW96_21065 [Tychonema bourrellyi B0820]|jgi:hypothetical protein|nr:hypothetical protein [Tychonema bourrellyi]MDQ2100127.1 hypothetical protein [Tychonema bourrellyi B0820]
MILRVELLQKVVNYLEICDRPRPNFLVGIQPDISGKITKEPP